MTIPKKYNLKYARFLEEEHILQNITCNPNSTLNHSLSNLKDKYSFDGRLILIICLCFIFSFFFGVFVYYVKVIRKKKINAKNRCLKYLDKSSSLNIYVGNSSKPDIIQNKSKNMKTGIKKNSKSLINTLNKDCFIQFTRKNSQISPKENQKTNKINGPKRSYSNFYNTKLFYDVICINQKNQKNLKEINSSYEFKRNENKCRFNIIKKNNNLTNNCGFKFPIDPYKENLAKFLSQLNYSREKADESNKNNSYIFKKNVFELIDLRRTEPILINNKLKNKKNKIRRELNNESLKDIINCSYNKDNSKHNNLKHCISKYQFTSYESTRKSNKEDTMNSVINITDNHNKELENNTKVAKQEFNDKYTGKLQKNEINQKNQIIDDEKLREDKFEEFEEKILDISSRIDNSNSFIFDDLNNTIVYGKKLNEMHGNISCSINNEIKNNNESSNNFTYKIENVIIHNNFL